VSLLCVSCPPLYDLRTQYPCVDQLRDLCHLHSSYAHVVCSYCQSYNYDMNSCPYYGVSNESYATLNAMTEITN